MRSTPVRCDSAALGVSTMPCGTCVPCRNRVSAKKWQDENPAKSRENKTKYRLANRESLNTKSLVANLPPDQVIRKNAKRRQVRADNPEAARTRRGLVFESGHTVEMLIDQQNGCCAICGCDLRRLPSKQVHADHDHSITDGSPNVRGILCGKCNLGLGYFKDKLSNLSAAFDYILNPPAL